MKKELACAVRGICTAEESVPLSKMTSFGIGGEAALCAFPKNECEVAALLQAAHKFGERFAVLGNMTNILASDEGFDGLVIVTRGLCDIFYDGERVTAGAGASVSALARDTAERGLSGFEFAYGIPGSVGGGIYMNAGAYGGTFSDVVASVRAYDAETEEIVEYSTEECGFGNRLSRFSSSGEIILSATFALRKGNREEILAKMRENMRARKEKQPLELPSAGSVFKRPEGNYAGALIERAGLKGYCIGGAKISEKHAGFIVNVGGATENDVARLIEYIKEKVYGEFGVVLEQEIINLR